MKLNNSLMPIGKVCPKYKGYYTESVTVHWTEWYTLEDYALGAR